jgi:DNA primase
MASILNRKPQEGSKQTFELPTYLLGGFASENALRMALKYDLIEAHTNKVFRTDYDPRLDRQVFYYRNNLNNAVVGAMGRALRAHNRPKAYIYPGSIKTPWICGKFDEAVICEDIFSAVKCYNIGKTGIALSGTTLAVEYLNLFKDYKKIYICLDKDASLRSLDMKKLLDIFNKDVTIRLLEKDLKDLTRDEARKIFE